MYEIGQIIISLLLVSLGIWFIAKKKSSKASKAVGIIIIILVILGALGPYLSRVNSDESNQYSSSQDKSSVNNTVRKSTHQQEERYRTEIANSILAGENSLTRADAECIADATVEANGVAAIDYMIDNNQSPFTKEANSLILSRCGVSSYQ